MKQFIYLLIAIMPLVSCKKEGVEPTNDPEKPDSIEQIDLANMEVGQLNKYKLLLGQRYYAADSHQDFEYTEDTLTVEILAEENGRFQWLEHTENPQFGAKDSISYWVSIEGDSLVIEPIDDAYSTHLFYGLHLNTWSGKAGQAMKIPIHEIQQTECEVQGWKTTLPYQESYREAYDEQFSLFGVDYGRVNVIIDNIPMQLDGNGKTYVYSLDRGIVRTSTYSWWTGQGFGWDLLPAE